MHRLWLITGALAGLIAVGLSAWAAHGLPARLEPARMAAVQNALTMQGWHALALLLAGLMAEAGRRLAHFAAAAFLAGLSLVPVLLNKRFGRYDYTPSLEVYADSRRVYRRQIAWLTVASIAGMVLLFDAA